VCFAAAAWLLKTVTTVEEWSLVRQWSKRLKWSGLPSTPELCRMAAPLNSGIYTSMSKLIGLLGAMSFG